MVGEPINEKERMVGVGVGEGHEMNIIKETLENDLLNYIFFVVKVQMKCFFYC